MDDLFIQEEVIVKTEPNDSQNSFEDNLAEKFLLDGPHNDDLLAYLNHSNPKDKNFIKKVAFRTEEPPNIFETGSHFMQPDTMISHYEEVVQEDITSSALNNDDLLANVKDVIKKEPKQRKSGRKKKGTRRDVSSRAKAKASIKKEEDENCGFSFECSLCMFTTGSEDSLKHHMLDHIGGPDTDTFVEESHNGDAYTCLFCPFISVSADLFRDHIKYKHSSTGKSGKRIKTNHHPAPSPPPESEDDDDEDEDEDDAPARVPSKSSGRHSCKLCKVITRSKDEMNRHVLKCHSEKLLHCSHCDFATFYKSTLKRHEWRHSQVKLYSCKQCTFSTRSVELFNSHEETHLQAKYPCEECNFRGKTKETLRQHKKIHSGDMPYVCSYCPYKAAKMSRIVRHERIHTGERPFACPHCSFRCNQGSTLKIHIRRHTGEKPYECSVCSFRAVSKCSLNAHLKKHNSSKGGEYVCQICEQIYNNHASLKKHEKTHDDDLEGYLKPVTNKRRKSDFLAEAAAGSIPPPKYNIKRRRRRANSEVKKPQKAPSEEIDQKISPPLPGLYRCTLCPYRCNRFVELSDHMSSHKKNPSDEFSSGDIPKKYRCTPCNLSFSRKKELKVHMKEKHEGRRAKDKEVTIKIGDYVLSVTDD